MSTLWQSIAGLPNFLLYFALALVLLTIFVAIYVRVTSYREFVLIRWGRFPVEGAQVVQFPAHR